MKMGTSLGRNFFLSTIPRVVLVKQVWRFRSVETTKLIRDGEKEGGGV